MGVLGQGEHRSHPDREEREPVSVGVTTLRVFLREATEAARSLAALHQASGVHGALTPAWLGFGTQPGPSEAWAYRAPEQTGRLQRPVDAHTDLYALGVILFERLTGALPFQAQDPLEWAHRHLAMPPRRPRTIDPEIPDMVEQVLLRLLEKDPDDRYQTADGLRHDLDRCLAQWECEGSIAPFALGERDRTDRLSIPHKLHGRAHERRALLDAFVAVREGRGPRVLLVAGRSGVGKSALVRELAAPVAAADGLLVSGKFEDGPRGVPYAPIAAGFGDLVTLILAGREEALAAWRARLQAAVGHNGRVLIDVLPQLELVLGSQPTVALLPPAEAHYRFADAFRRFVAEFATPAHPLVMLLDDLQWGDAASLRLVSALVSERSLRSLLVVGVYRDDIPPNGPLLRMLHELRDTGAPVETIELGPLGPEPLTELLAEALGMDQTECSPLQTLLSEKTAGNPLFFTQLILDLRRAGLVRFDRSALAWRWDADGIRREAVSANVVELLTERLAGCPPEMQEALSLAACLNGSFDAALLARLRASGVEDTVRLIADAVGSGLLTRGHEGYRFSHDRVREAAYAAIPVRDRPSTHLRIGRSLLAAGADIFDAVGQLDRGRSAIAEPSERRELAVLNRLAAERARATAAFDAVSEYSHAGLELLGEKSWADEHDLAFALTREAAEAELYAGNLEEVERLLSAAIANARTRLERTMCARLWINLKATTGAVLEGLGFVFEVLRTHGLDIRMNPTNVDEVELVMRERLGDQPLDAVLDLPLGEHRDIEEALDLLARSGAHAYVVDPELHRLIACYVVDLTLQHGIYPASSWGLAAYGLELAIAERYAEAGRFVDIALRLVDRHSLVAYRAFVCILGAEDVWTRELDVAAGIAREGIRSGIENGDMFSACVCWHLLGLRRFAAGHPLAEVEHDVQEGLEFTERVGFARQANTTILLRQLVRALCGRTDRLSSLTSADFDEIALQDSLASDPLGYICPRFHVHRLQAEVFAGAFAEALATNEVLEPELARVRGQHIQADAVFFGALALAGCDDGVRQARVGQLRTQAELLEAWATTCPPSFAHEAALVAGEVRRTQRRPAEALELFAVATARAQTSGFLHVEALAHESAARLCREEGLDGTAAQHIRDAIDCYRRWGAAGKVGQLEAQLRSVAAAVGDPPADALDALAVVKASQAISGEVVHERVLERLLETVIAHAGARGGVLMLWRDGQLRVAATAERTASGVAVTIHDPPREAAPEIVAETVVNYVKRTKRPLIIADAAARPPFDADPYIRARHVKSMLCLPMLAQRELRGLLCLENDLIADAFTTDSLAALEVLNAQAAISLENASLYSELRREIAERQRYEAQLQHLADHDSLTGLFNRRRFNEELEHELARARRSGTPGAVLSIDLDDFKYVNDSLGHSTGDRLISETAALLARRVRASDVIARIGGDEFALILPGVDESEAELVAHALLKAVREDLKVDFAGGSRAVTASAGIAPYSPAGDLSGEELLVQADIAMYDAKEAGRNCAALYSSTDERHERMQARLTWGERIRRALEHDRLVLYAQPIVPLGRDGVARHELLVRMLDDDGGLIAPGAFLPIAERMDLIDRIDRWVVSEAIRLLGTEQRAGHKLMLNVNLSAASVGDEGLPDDIARALEHERADGRGLCFEITESVAIINMERARRFAARIAKLGCQFALDDFGTGFASFYYVKHLPFDYLKIDGEFVQDLAGNRTDQLVVKSITEIARGLGKRTIAEFVSDAHTLELLRSYGVDYAQGYHISKPTPVAQTNLGRQMVIGAEEKSRRS